MIKNKILSPQRDNFMQRNVAENQQSKNKKKLQKKLEQKKRELKLNQQLPGLGAVANTAIQEIRKEGLDQFIINNKLESNTIEDRLLNIIFKEFKEKKITTDNLKKILVEPEYNKLLNKTFSLEKYHYLFSKIPLDAIKHLTLLEAAAFLDDTMIGLSLMMRLLQAGANPNLGRHLPLIASLDKPLMINVLLDNHKINKVNETTPAIKTNVNCTRPDKVTAIQCAVMQNKKKACELLLNHEDIDVLKKARDNKPPLELSLINIEEHSKNNDKDSLVVTKAIFSLLMLKIEKSIDTTLLSKDIKTSFWEEIAFSIRLLLKDKQKESAIKLMNKVIDFKIDNPNYKFSEETLKILKSCFASITHIGFDLDLFELYLSVSAININEEFYFDGQFTEKFEDTGKYEILTSMNLLSWVVANSALDPYDAFKWMKLLLEKGANPNCLIASRPLLQLIIKRHNTEVLEYFLKSNKIYSATISILLCNNICQESLEKWMLLNKYNYPNLKITRQAIHPDLKYALMKDNWQEFKKEFQLHKITDEESIIFWLVLYDSPKIIENYFQNNNMFHLLDQEKNKAFFILLLKNSFNVLNKLWEHYLIREKSSFLLTELNECKVLLDSEQNPKLQLWLERYSCKEENVNNALEQIKKFELRIKQKSECVSNTKSTLFTKENKGITGRRFLLEAGETLPEIKDEIPKKQEMNINTKSRQEINELTIFNLPINENLDLREIRNSNSTSFFVLKPGVDLSENKSFTKNTYTFSPKSLKAVQFHHKVNIKIGDKVEPLEITHELKSHDTPDRIYVIKCPCDNNAATIYIGYKYDVDGLHKTGDIKQLNESLKNSKVEDFEFLINPRPEKNNSLSKI